LIAGPSRNCGEAGLSGTAAVLAPFATGPVANFRPDPDPKPAPDLAFQDKDQKPVKLSDFRGRLVLLNLWATWCVPCREEMPTLDRLEGALGSDRFEVVALSVDLNGHDLAKAFLAEVKADHIALYNDPTSRANFLMKGYGLPTTVLIGPDGRELGRLVGPAAWDSPEAKALVEAALKATAAH
jgi:thiol-disulfide isomerase/thioredoxin